MGSFRLGAGSDEWLVAVGRVKKRGELSHLYMAREATSPLELMYADLTVAMPTSDGVQSVVSMAEAGGQLHLALQTDAGEPPRMVVLRATPTSPGIDATAGDAFGISFAGTPIEETGPGNSPIAQVDAIKGFEGRVFVANRRGVLVSNGPASELTGGVAASQFTECTPRDPASWTSTAIDRNPSDRDVTPADRGVTGFAVWQEKLYLARNTAAAVPELWVFTPRHDGTGAFLGCALDRSDWRLVATNLGDAGNTHLTALFASERYLYVGYDNAAGVQLWRTEAADPREADFVGPLAGPGLGAPSSNPHFFDARAISDGTLDHVWVTVGSGDVPVGVYRISEP
jgi:hypothetical protein